MHREQAWATMDRVVVPRTSLPAKCRYWSVGHSGVHERDSGVHRYSHMTLLGREGVLGVHCSRAILDTGLTGGEWEEGVETSIGWYR